MPPEVTDREVFDKMLCYGGSFIKHLALAGLHADSNNLQKIKTTWQNDWEKYTDLVLADKLTKEAL